MICRACGAALEENAAFCKKCGARLTTGGNDQHVVRDEKRKLFLASAPVLALLIVLLLAVTVDAVRTGLPETLSTKAENGEAMSVKEERGITQAASSASETEKAAATAVRTQAETDSQTTASSSAPQSSAVYNEDDVIRSMLSEAGVLIETEQNDDSVTPTESYIWSEPENTWDLDGMGN